MSTFHGFWALVLTASEALFFGLIFDIATIPFSAFDVQLREVAVTRDPYHLCMVYHCIQISFDSFRKQ